MTFAKLCQKSGEEGIIPSGARLSFPFIDPFVTAHPVFDLHFAGVVFRSLSGLEKLYQSTHELTGLVQSRVAMDRMRSGAAISLFHATQHASTISSYVA